MLPAKPGLLALGELLGALGGLLNGLLFGQLPPQ